ncbi:MULTISPECIES: hypothetical protein [unclassified Pseudomonas]|nr:MULTISPECIES: hypothetical protein [unclassified Pseudomonas]
MTELLSTMDEKAATFMDLLEAGQFSIELSPEMNDEHVDEPEMTTQR